MGYDPGAPGTKESNIASKDKLIKPATATIPPVKTPSKDPQPTSRDPDAIKYRENPEQVEKDEKKQEALNKSRDPDAIKNREHPEQAKKDEEQQKAINEANKTDKGKLKQSKVKTNSQNIYTIKDVANILAKDDPELSKYIDEIFYANKVGDTYLSEKDSLHSQELHHILNNVGGSDYDKANALYLFARRNYEEDQLKKIGIDPSYTNKKYIYTDEELAARYKDDALLITSISDDIIHGIPNAKRGYDMTGRKLDADGTLNSVFFSIIPAMAIKEGLGSLNKTVNAEGPVTTEVLAKETLAKDTLIKETLTKDVLSKETLTTEALTNKNLINKIESENIKVPSGVNLKGTTENTKGSNNVGGKGSPGNGGNSNPPGGKGNNSSPTGGKESVGNETIAKTENTNGSVSKDGKPISNTSKKSGTEINADSVEYENVEKNEDAIKLDPPEGYFQDSDGMA